MKLTKTATKLNIPIHSLGYWRRVGLLSSKPRTELDFTDIVKARFIHFCRKQGISLQFLRRVTQKIPTWQQHLVIHGRNTLAIRKKNMFLDLEDKQILLNFEENTKQIHVPISLQRNKQKTKYTQHCSKLNFYYQQALEGGDTKLMERILKKMVQIQPSYIGAWVELGNLLFSLKRNREAYHAYKKALEHDSKCSEALYNLGNLHFKAKRYAAAIRCFKICLQVEPEFAEAYYNFGLLLYQIGYYQAAIEVLECYLQLDPASFWSDQARQFIEDAQSALQTK